MIEDEPVCRKCFKPYEIRNPNGYCPICMEVLGKYAPEKLIGPIDNEAQPL
jgi:hypothetical protein